VKTNRFVSKVAKSLDVTERHMVQRVYPVLQAEAFLNDRTGRADAPIDSAIAAMILLCLVSPTAGEAMEVCRRAGKLMLVPHPDHDLATLGLPPPPDCGYSLAVFLGVAIETGCIDGQALDGLQEVSISPDGAYAFALIAAPAGFIRLVFADAETTARLEERPAADDRRRAQNALGWNHPSARMTLGRGFLSQCHIWVHRETKSGWVGDGSPGDLQHRQFVASQKVVRELALTYAGGAADGEKA
jgi:hypothetical protein